MIRNIETVRNTALNNEEPVNIEKPKLNRLRWWDVLIVSLIMFTGAIKTSTEAFLASFYAGPAPASLDESLSQLPEFTPFDDLSSFLLEVMLFTVAWLYLRARRFDFRIWKFDISLKSSLKGAGLFLLWGLLMDALFLCAWGPSTLDTLLFSHGFMNALFYSTLMLVIFSFMNGFYEEVFFLGVCAETDPKWRWGYFIFSVLVRISFHTYQGMIPALGIGIILGAVNWYIYTRKTRNLWIPVFAHALCDIAGLTALGLI